MLGRSSDSAGTFISTAALAVEASLARGAVFAHGLLAETFGVGVVGCRSRREPRYAQMWLQKPGDNQLVGVNERFDLSGIVGIDVEYRLGSGSVIVRAKVDNERATVAIDGYDRADKIPFVLLYGREGTEPIFVVPTHFYDGGRFSAFRGARAIDGIPSTYAFGLLVPSREPGKPARVLWGQDIDRNQPVRVECGAR